MTHLSVEHSLFDQGALTQAIAGRYELGAISSLVLHRSYVNDVYRIETRTGAEFFLKIARRSWRNAQDVAWNVALQRHLHRHHLSVAEPVPQRDGEVVCVLDAPEGERVAVLYKATPGAKPRPPFSPELYARVGATTARMHNALDHFAVPCPQPDRTTSWLIERSAAIVDSSLDREDANRGFIVEFSRWLANDVERRAPALDWGVCHGDLTLDNLTVGHDGTISLFDFDLAAPAWRASEPVGVYTWSLEDPAARPLWKAFLAGYRSERAFSAGDEAAVPPLAAAHDLWDLAHEIEHWRSWSGDWRSTPEVVSERIGRLRTWAERLGMPATADRRPDLPVRSETIV